jgi:hypothetical protein
VSKGEFEQMVRTAKEHIAAGDIYQVVLSQRFEGRSRRPVHGVSRAAAREPVALHVLSCASAAARSSARRPRCWCGSKGRKVQTHPIAGTRPRGRTEEEDVRLGDGAQAQREGARRARDAGGSRPQRRRAVSAYGSVRVAKYMALERYSHVMHLVSVVEARSTSDTIDSMRWWRAFPAGTVSGAPKVRAMEIIAALENRRRGVYAGAVGYLDFRRQPRLLHHHPHGADRERSRLRAGGRRNRGRLQPDGGVRRDAGQGSRRDSRARDGAGRAVGGGSLDMILVIDNYDSFTYNLVQYLGELGAEIRVKRNDDVSVGEIETMAPEQI